MTDTEEKDKDGKIKKGKIKIDLSPTPTWGGDPLKSIIKPSFLHLIKKVYSGDDEVVFDLMDRDFMPEDIFMG